MKEKITADIGEEIISKLKELNEILKLMVKESKNGKKRSPTYSSGNRISKFA